MASQRLSESSAKKLISDVDNFLFDCDGKILDECLSCQIRRILFLNPYYY